MPLTNGSKEEYIERLFASIAPRYDLLNSILSFNCHKRWRAFAVRQCGLSPGDFALDLCAGTLDFAVQLSRAVEPSGVVVGVDFCRPMLDLGMRKLARLGIGNILAVEGNAERIPAASDSCQAATIGFALRNVGNVEKTLAEMVRVVRPGGRVVSLELARPEGPVFGRIYRLYAHRILPLVGGLIHGNSEPYRYLPASVESFYSREELSLLMEKVGLGDIRVHDLTGGVVAVHVGIKK